MPKAPIRQVFRYWKPTGVLSTTLPCKDGQNILQHSPPLARYLAEATANGVVVPIGRLDKASDGLLLLTTDPSLCALLLRPGQRGSRCEKEYYVTTSHRMPDEALERCRSGIQIRNRNQSITTLPCVVERLSQPGSRIDDGSSCNLRFILQEGKNRQIRKMVGFFSHSVQHLTRVRFGNVTLDGLCEGEASELSDDEINSLLQICGKQG